MLLEDPLFAGLTCAHVLDGSARACGHQAESLCLICDAPICRDCDQFEERSFCPDELGKED